ncbi:CocE/NonD family hydrolase [Gordonia sp. YC-JH1]|uniref:CocE/NonD family hydrolase n=1 Tax=Gordonia sp. YC-JH1 TaxID=2059875 RepID=UPI002279BD06|nr:CocE/NonD family hydrolase [Gordonia sp. YC-JH1]
MEVVNRFDRRVEVIENLFITMHDGTRLAARVWMPEDANSEPVPAVLEYLPYRKRDDTRERDSLHHPYIAGHGYASVRVDIRGTGDSDGVLRDEYLPSEQEDACEVIAWLAEQPWCDGNVGMMGISWGGFNSLHVAARRPPALRAIISASATDDLYVDNMHYMGGCLLSDNLSEATVMFVNNSLPRIRTSSDRGGARCGANDWRAAVSGPRSGSSTSIAMTTGSARPSRRTTHRSRCR